MTRVTRTRRTHRARERSCVDVWSCARGREACTAWPAVGGEGHTPCHRTRQPCMPRAGREEHA
eukprot:1459688-Prymnesium_polylepis.1